MFGVLELMEVIRQLQAEGWSIGPADLAEISPYITEPIRRFGEYSTDELDLRPDAFDPNLDVDFDALTDPRARGSLVGSDEFQAPP